MVAVDQGLAHLGRSVQSAAAEKGSYPLINYMDKRAPPFHATLVVAKFSS